MKRVRTIDPQTGRVKTKLQFTEATKKPPSSKLIRSSVTDAAVGKLHHEVREVGEDNAGVDSANTMAQSAEAGAHTATGAYRRSKLKPYSRLARGEKRETQANLSALNKTFAHNSGFYSNPYSRWQQKRAIRREYARVKKAGGGTVSAAQTTAKAARRAAEGSGKAAAFVARHSGGFFATVGLTLIAAMLLSVFSSCSVLLQGGAGSLMISTYPSEDADMLAAEAQYCALEQELQDYLDSYESAHSYDEYNCELDAIGHDPYVLISAVTALYGGVWMIDDVGDILQFLFDYQYTLTETVEVETRYTTETWTDSEGNEHETETSYDYYICTVTLDNFNLSHVPVYVMSEAQLSMYAVYMSTLGNRTDLFPDSGYIALLEPTEYADYEVSAEALEDEQFAAMLAEAEKYLGYPYVWGGSSPSTSFDCSGFVSWVINNCGVGWNVGRLSANGLLSLCTRISADEAQPGDLIFFENTYDTAGASHVGIYIGDGMMIHCGSPIQYTSINTSYWQSHLLCFGRLPSP